jgi:trans-aconitate 2-methyltransferase
MSWEPTQYLKYSSERLRPALDLLARISSVSPRTVVDLGCGAGNVTAVLAERWPCAPIVGVDNSPAMLARARTLTITSERIEWIEADLATFAPAAPADVVFSNAALSGSMTTKRFFRASSQRSRTAACSQCRCPTSSGRRRM